MGAIIQDLRYAFRMLRSNPGFTVIAVLVLALGIGANSAIFSVVNAVLLQPLAYPDSERLAQVGRRLPMGFSSALSPAQFLFYKDHNDSFVNMATYDGQGGGMNLTGGEMPERLPSRRISAEFFRVLQVQPHLGRDFLPEDGKKGAEKVAVITYGLWQRRFGGDPEIIGRPIRLSGDSYTVIGVVDHAFHPAIAADVWTPLILDPNDRSAVYYIVARMKPGVTLESAQADMDGVIEEFRRERPDFLLPSEAPVVRPFFDQIVGDIGSALLILVGTVAVVLLIACANVANLLLARATTRHREIALRTALGASRTRIIRQLLTESGLLALIGGGLGLLIAHLAMRTMLWLKPSNLPRLDEIVIDDRVLGYTLLVVLATGILFGLFPAFQASKLDLQEMMKEGGSRLSAGGRRGLVRNILVVIEVMLALVLLIGASLLINSFLRLRELNPGFDYRNVLTMKMSPSGAEGLTTERATIFRRQAIERIEALPGVEAAATISTLPLEHGLMQFFDIAGRPPPDPKERTGRAQWRLISPDYFRAMGIPMLRGRTFTDQDTPQSPPVFIINSALAQQYFPDEDPVGKGLLTGGPSSETPPTEIVGVVGNIREVALHRDPTPTLYSPATQAQDGLTSFLAKILPTCWVLRTSGNPHQYSAAVQEEILAVDNDQPVSSVRTMEQVMSESVAQRQFNTLLLTLLAGLAVLLAAIGIYGVMSYSVAQRIHEIGIRIAIGAGRSETFRLVLIQGLKLTLIGVLAGLGIAFFATKVLSAMLFEVSATDPMIFGFMAVLLFVVAALACYVPARRAMRVDPIVALRYE